MFCYPTSFSISRFAPSLDPTSKPPFIMNFMLDVPEGSVPGVEICWLKSAAATKSSQRATLKLGAKRTLRKF